jgi:TolB-like protein/Flp pilus assembly protein TadD
MDRNTLLRRLKERKVVQWGLLYLAGAWVLLQFADFLGDTFDWPVVSMQVLLVLAAFGLLGILVLAWYHGDRGHQRMTTVEVLLLVVIAAAASAATWQVGVRGIASASAGGGTGAGTGNALVPVSDEPVDPRSIAVLPFANFGGAQEDEYFSDGVTEDIIAQLARIDGLRVISRTSVMQYKGTSKTVRQIGEELGVAAVLEGSVRRSGDQVRIVAQLIDARTDEHLWAETYDRGVQDVLKIQADVARRIAQALEAELSPVQMAELSEAEIDPEAYSLYLKGRELANSEAPEDAARAAELFSEALGIDSTFTFAYSALAETMSAVGVRVGQETSGAVVVATPDVDSIMRVALAKVPRAPEVQTYAVRQNLGRWNFEQAAEAGRRAVQQNPNHAPARQAYANVLSRRGEYDAALRELEQARALDPHSPSILSDLGEVHFAAGHFDEAIRQLRATVQRFPDHVDARINLALAYRAQGRNEEALAELRRAAERSPESPVVLGMLGQLLAEAGQPEEARRILGELMQRGRPTPPVAVAQIYSGLGEHDEAVRWLERAARERSATLVNPRWNRLLQEMHLDSATARRIFVVPMPPTPPAGPPPRDPGGRGRGG